MSIFSRIIAGELPCDKVFENDRWIVIKDIAPKAPVHLLIIPKKPYMNFQSVPPQDYSLMVELIELVQDLALEFEIANNYRLITNNGSDAGQSVFHLHFHLIGGAVLKDMA